MIAVEPRFRLQAGEIGTCIRLGEALAPDLFRAENFWNVPLLLRFGSTGDDGRSNETQAQRVSHGRRLDARHLFPEYGLLHQRGASATVLLRPGNCRPAAFLELPLPRAKIRKRFLKRLLAPFIPILWHIGSKPRAEFITKCQLLGG